MSVGVHELLRGRCLDAGEMSLRCTKQLLASALSEPGALHFQPRLVSFDFA